MAEALLRPLRAARQAPPLHEANFALAISRACSPVLQPLRLHRPLARSLFCASHACHAGELVFWHGGHNRSQCLVSISIAA